MNYTKNCILYAGLTPFVIYALLCLHTYSSCLQFAQNGCVTVQKQTHSVYTSFADDWDDLGENKTGMNTPCIQYFDLIPEYFFKHSLFPYFKIKTVCRGISQLLVYL